MRDREDRSGKSEGNSMGEVERKQSGTRDYHSESGAGKRVYVSVIRTRNGTRNVRGSLEVSYESNVAYVVQIERYARTVALYGNTETDTGKALD